MVTLPNSGSEATHGYPNCSRLIYLRPYFERISSLREPSKRDEWCSSDDTCVVAAWFLGENIEGSRLFLQEHGRSPRILEKVALFVASIGRRLMSWDFQSARRRLETTECGRRDYYFIVFILKRRIINEGISPQLAALK